MIRIDTEKNSNPDAAKADLAHRAGLDRLENHGLLLMEERSGERTVDREFAGKIKPVGTDAEAGRMA